MPSLPGWDGFLYEKTYIPKKKMRKRKLDLVTFPFACHFGPTEMWSDNENEVVLD